MTLEFSEFLDQTISAQAAAEDPSSSIGEEPQEQRSQEPPRRDSGVEKQTDLAVCPPEILALDPNAETLWPRFVRAAGCTTSATRKKKIIAADFWVDNDNHRALIVRQFGIPSLIQRLSVAKDEVGRARAWWRESQACAEGDTISDLSAENMHVLNPFIVSAGLKFSRPEPKHKPEWPTGERSSSATKVPNVKRAREHSSPNGKRYCENTTAGQHPLPTDIRTEARYCDRACWQAAYRGRVASERL